jgi:hypothetical protein
VNTGDLFPELLVAQERVLHYQRKLHAWAQHHAICPWSAGCGGSRTSGAEGGGEETTGRKADTGASPSTLQDETACWDPPGASTGTIHAVRRRSPASSASVESPLTSRPGSDR